MRISVVIPAYNEEKYLPICLESLQKQTFRDFEIIVVDNNSTDKTAETATHHGARVTPEPKKGVGAARKKGFAEAKGDIIVSTDADNTFPEDWLQKILNFFEKNPDDVAVYGSIIFDDPSIIKKYLSYTLLTLFFQVNDWLNKKQFPGANFAVRKEAYAKSEGFNDQLGIVEDGDLSKKLMKIGKITFKPSIIIESSTRRFQQGNLLKNILMYWNLYRKTWWTNTSTEDHQLEDIR